MTRKIQPQGSPDPEPRRPLQERYASKLDSFGQIIREVTTARLTLYQRFTSYITLGTFVLDAKVITATTDLRVLLIVNAPAFILVLVAGFLEIHARFRNKAAPNQGAQDRPKTETEKVRLNLEVPKKLRSQLDDLVARSNATNLTEVVRRALALYDLFLEHSSEGGDVLFRYPDGTSEVLRIL